MRKDPRSLDKLVENLQDVYSKPVKVHPEDGELFYFHFGKSGRRSKRKRLLIGVLPGTIQQMIGDPGEIDNFYYAVLLYTIFSALQARMCGQAYKLSLKILPFG